MNRVSATAAARPMPMPTSASVAPWRTTMPRTRPWTAPSAMRIPSSRRRWVTEYAITPYSPSAASTSAVAPNAARSTRLNRRGASGAATTSSMARNRGGAVGATSAATRRAAAISRAAPPSPAST
jgi:hypothetical protein